MKTFIEAFKEARDEQFRLVYCNTLQTFRVVNCVFPSEEIIYDFTFYIK